MTQVISGGTLSLRHSMDAAALAERRRASTLCGQDNANMRRVIFIFFIVTGAAVGGSLPGMETGACELS